MTPSIRTCLLLAVLIAPLLSGCDPFERKGTWSLPQDGFGANDTNLRRMVVNPADLTTPHGDEDSSVGALSAHPVAKLYSGQRSPLPNVSAAQLSGSNGQQNGNPGNGGGGPLGTGPQY